MVSIARILVVEDDADLSNIIRLHLEHAGHTPTAADSYAEAECLLAEQVFDLIILDVVLPDRRGLDLCAVVREKSLCPIIFTSCLDDSQTIINALQLGGDDYMVKPLRYDEMLARVEANLRRHRPSNGSLREYPTFTIDTTHHSVHLRSAPGKEVPLSAIEYSLLLYLTEHPGTLLLYQDLYQSVWNADSAGDTRTVMVHISNLRKKIDPDHIGIIQTVRGAGYLFSPDPGGSI